MAVYFKFKSATDYHSIPVDGPFISIINLKERIFNSKLLGKGKDYDLIITNAQTNEDYLDEAMLIPKNISVLLRRVPGPPCKPIVTQPDKPKVENQAEDDQPVKGNFKPRDSSGFLDTEASEWDDVFGSSLYTTSVLESAPSSKSDEDSKIKALVENSGLKQLNHHTEGYGLGRRSGSGRGFGQGGWNTKTPPQGYVCHRCKVAGHFIQYCPTNGDPDYDIKKPLIGIPKPNEVAFEKEMEGLPSTRSHGDLPPELHCPLCKEVMKDAVLTSKCCFMSFCDKCIRDNIISKSMCICGKKEILADDLIPNMTLRDTINSILESGSSSAINSGSGLRHKDASSARSHQPRIPSPTQSAASKGAQMVPADAKETPNLKENVDDIRHNDAPQQLVQSSSEVKITKVPDLSQAAVESVILKETDSILPVQEGQQKAAVVETGKKKRKKMSNPANAADMGWMGMQPYMGGYMEPITYNGFWPGMQHVVNEFWSPFGGSMPYNMGYGLGSSGNLIPSDPSVAQGFMSAAMLTPSQRNLDGELGANMNVRSRTPFLDREDFVVRKAEVRRNQEMGRHVGRDLPQNCDYGREESSNGKASSMRSKHKSLHARSSLSKERYSYNHNCDNGYKNEHNRSSRHGKDNRHENEYKRPSIDHHRFSDHHNSDSHRFTTQAMT